MRSISKWLLSILMIACLIIPACATLSVKPSTDNGGVFGEIATLAKEEGVEHYEGVFEAYREYNGKLLSIGYIPSVGFSAIGEYSKDLSTLAVVGYFPNENEKYKTVLIYGSNILAESVMIKEEAEKLASDLLNIYKSGKKTTIEEYMSRQNALPI